MAKSQLEIIISVTDKASKQMDAIGKRMRNVGKTLTKNVTLPLVAMGAAAVKAASDMDKEMRNVQAITKQTDAEIAALSSTIVDMSTDINTTVDSAANLASSMFNISSAGFAGEEGLTVLRAATKAATAGLTDTTTAAEATIAVLKTYDLGVESATNVTDVMFTTIERGIGSYEGLAAAIPQVLPPAKLLGVTFEEQNAALTTLSQRGIDFSRGATAVRSSMNAMLAPTKDMRDILDALGFATGEAMVASLGYQGALAAIVTEAERTGTPLKKVLGRVEAMNAAAILGGSGAAAFSENLAAMADASGATQEAFEQQIKSFDAQFKSFKNNVTAIMIELGNIILPVLNDIMKGVKPILQAFRALPAPVKTGVVAFLALAAAIGPLVFIFGTGISVIGSIIGALGALGGIMTTITVAAPALGAAFTVMTGPIGLLIVGIGAAVFLLVKNFDKVKAALQGLWEMGKNFIKNLRENFDLSEFVRWLVNQWVNMQKKIFGVLWSIVKKIPEFGKWIIEGLVKGFIDSQKILPNAIKEIGEGIIDGFKDVFGIGSPSTVMAEVGMNMAEGVAVGYSQGFNQFATQAASQMQQFSGAMRGAAGGALGGAGIGATAGTSFKSSATRSGLNDAISQTINSIRQAGGFLPPKGSAGFQGVIDRFRQTATTGAGAGIIGGGERGLTIDPNALTPVMQKIQQRALDFFLQSDKGQLFQARNQATKAGINIEQLILPVGTPREHADEILKIIDKKTKGQGL